MGSSFVWIRDAGYCCCNVSNQFIYCFGPIAEVFAYTNESCPASHGCIRIAYWLMLPSMAYLLLHTLWYASLGFSLNERDNH